MKSIDIISADTILKLNPRSITLVEMSWDRCVLSVIFMNGRRATSNITPMIALADVINAIRDGAHARPHLSIEDARDTELAISVIERGLKMVMGDVVDFSQSLDQRAKRAGFAIDLVRRGLDVSLANIPIDKLIQTVRSCYAARSSESGGIATSRPSSE